MRTFFALDIDPAIRTKIAQFMDGLRGFAPEVRWVNPESLHLTLKFLGEQSQETVDKIEESVSQLQLEAFDIVFTGYGFFPTAKAARVFWVGVQSGPQLARVAAAIDEATAKLGVPAEDRPFSPHLTLARSGSGSPKGQKGDRANRRFLQLQEKLAAFSPPEFGTMSAREFFLYGSKLLRGGPQYSKIKSFALGNGV